MNFVQTLCKENTTGISTMVSEGIQSYLMFDQNFSCSGLRSQLLELSHDSNTFLFLFCVLVVYVLGWK